MVKIIDNAAKLGGLRPKPLLNLHYYFDPLCGWCYAAAPLIHAAAELEGLAIQLHAGGMMSGENRQTVTPALRNYVMPHDQRIAALTGQVFGDAYFNDLLLNESAIFDSTPPTLAILVAASLGGDVGIGVNGLAMLARIQQAHYGEGQRIADESVLLDLASAAGFDRVVFAQAMLEQARLVEKHFSTTRQAMARQGLRGFPSLVLELGGKTQRIDVSPYLGKPAEFAAMIQALLAGENGVETSGTAAFCTPDGCAT